MTTQNFSPKDVWVSGYYGVLGELQGIGLLTSQHIESMESSYYTLRRPNGEKIGCQVDDTEIDEEDETDDDIEHDGLDEALITGAMIASKHCPYFEDSDGVRIYKATACRFAFSGQKLSSDRLRRVQGKTQFPGKAAQPETSHSVSAFLIKGEPILTSIIITKQG